MRLASFVVALAIAVPTSAAPLDIPSGTYRLDPTHASLTWRVSHFGLSFYTARFAKFDSTVNLDAADLSRSKLEVTIDPTSVRTDYPNAQTVDFDKKVGTDERLLNGVKFPSMTFTSTSIVKTGDRTGRVIGNLTMRGVTKPVELAAKFNGTLASHPFTKKQVFGVSATGKFKRSDFGMTYPAPAVADEVELVIEAEYTN